MEIKEFTKEFNDICDKEVEDILRLRVYLEQMRKSRLPNPIRRRRINPFKAFLCFRPQPNIKRTMPWE